MKYIPNYSTDPADNLAYEHFLLTNKIQTEPLLFFYINKPSVIIGRYQNAFAEVNLEYVWRHGIPVIRRMSGGGAVYHDYGNLNYSFILPNDNDMLDFAKLTKPILQALHAMGAKGATLSGRNDLEIDGKKFSGTAMYKKDSHILLHGTLLFRSDMSRLNDILQVRPDKIMSKGVKSVRSRVTNLVDYLDDEYRKMSTAEFKEALMAKLQNVDVTGYTITMPELRLVNDLKAEYYGNHQWNFGMSPEWTYNERQRFTFGEVEVAMVVRQDIIQEFKLYGDYFALRDVSELEDQFINLPYEKYIFVQKLRDINLQAYLPNMTDEEFLALCFAD